MDLKQSVPAVNTVYCPTCGATLEGPAAFCGACGSHLESAPALSVADATVPITPELDASLAAATAGDTSPAVVARADDPPTDTSLVAASDTPTDAPAHTPDDALNDAPGSVDGTVVLCHWCGARNGVDAVQCSACGAALPRPEADALLDQQVARIEAQEQQLDQQVQVRRGGFGWLLKRI